MQDGFGLGIMSHDCCCCPPIGDTCSKCGKEFDESAVYELILQGIGNCPFPFIPCQDCDSLNGTYILSFYELSTVGPSTQRTCIYRQSVGTLCRVTEFSDPDGKEDVEAYAQLLVIYNRYTNYRCETTYSFEFIPDSGMPLAKYGFSRTVQGAIKCGDTLDLEVIGGTDCGINSHCDRASATATLTRL